MVETAKSRIRPSSGALVVALAALVCAPVARADHDDWDDRDDRWEHGRDGWRHDPWPSPWYGPTYGQPREAFVFASLDGYGSWHFVPEVGAYLWFPYVERSWRPYYYGHWIQTPLGITWVAYEPWGDIPHHYGRWVFVDHAGWGWVPGYDYAPAWVTWAVGCGSVGWAPLPPAGYRYPGFGGYSCDRHVVG
jgi:hypothetical protein